MTLATPDAGVLTILLEDLDFDYQPNCEHGEHGNPDKSHDGGPAVWYVVMPECICGYPKVRLYICAAFGARLMRRDLVRCSGCRQLMPDVWFNGIQYTKIEAKPE